jgi:acyl transferase domain-containing protein/acyl carrier protein
MASNPSSDPRGLQIAIVGMAGRFPGAADVETFWKNIAAGVESIKFFSDEELQSAGVKSSLRKDPKFVSAACRLEGVDLFDASFFGFTPREAEIIDPQQRLFLECAWEALEAAGYDPEAYKGTVGVYAGSALHRYVENFAISDTQNPAGGFQATISNDKDHLSTRVSYKLNLTGPSVAVQTACSTSLVAVHMACQALVSGECDMALAGGVALLVPRPFGYVHQDGSMQSPDGHCRAFDAKARGTIFGEGMGIVVLKRLDDARADGDTIYAVIQGSAINNDGAQKVGYTAPSAGGQAKVIRVAQAVAEIEPETIGYVEAHGTGTELGDPIEIAALTQAFRAGTEKKGFCAIGSVKTNIGHANTAAGVAGLIKTALALKHKTLPPSLHFEAPNPKIDFANSPFYVNTEAKPWKADGRPRRAAVSSFGVGGTNAHAVLEEAPPEEPRGASRPWQLLLLSARSETALDAITANLARHLREHGDIDLSDAAHTLQFGRRIFSKRRMLVCSDVEDATTALEAKDARRVVSADEERRDRRVAFMFTGQGTQYAGMAEELYRAEPTFRSHVDECRALLKAHLPIDLTDLLFSKTSTNLSLDDTRFTQPALFVVEYALAKLWMEWGIEPQAMIGHSIGEYVAACIAGVFSLQDALVLVCARGRLMQALPAGAMLSVSLSEDRIRPLLAADVSLAAVNGPDLCVVAGPFDAIAALEKRLGESGAVYKRLRTSHAFHSSMMEPMLVPFRHEVEKIAPRAPLRPYISNVTGNWITPAEATDPEYWTRHIRQAVRFADGARELMKDGDLVLLEVGPGDTLATLARRNAAAADCAALASIRRAESKQSDVEFILNTLGRLWLLGAPVKWSGFYAHETRRRVPLPTYPFERERYWVEAGTTAKTTEAEPAVQVNAKETANMFYIPSWKQAASPEASGAAAEEYQWLIFADATGFGACIAETLGQENHVVVMPGEKFTRIDDRRYTIRPNREEDYNALFEELDKSQFSPNHVLHFWSLKLGQAGAVNSDAFDTSQQPGFYSLLYLAQNIGTRLRKPLKITVVSSDIFDVTGSENLRPENATLVGPCKTIPAEYPGVVCRLIDIDAEAIGTPREAELRARLLAELATEATESPVVLRGRHRWIQTFDSLPLKPATGQPKRLRQGGVYLITGGLGGIGLVLAEYLARTVRAKLVLVGRSSFPNRSQWSEWFSAHGEADKISQRIKKIQSLETLGAEVLVCSADVANLQQMQAVVESVHRRFGSINGIIHSAGVPSGGVIQLKNTAAVADIFSPKIKGLLVLDELLKAEQLDFFVLCSSLLSLTDHAGQVDYCAANAFLDAFAHSKSSNCKTFTSSINWDAWLEVGMAVDGQAELTASFRGIRPEEGVEAFARILTWGNTAQIAVSARNFKIVLKESLAANLITVDSPAAGKDTLLDHSNGRTDNKSEAEQIAKIWKDILGVAAVDADDNFFELGGNSLSAIQVISRVRTMLKAEVPLTALIAHPTLGELAAAVRESLKGRAESADLDRILADLEQISDEEAERLLAEEEQKG